jgi:hypothetical protein
MEDNSGISGFNCDNNTVPLPTLYLKFDNNSIYAVESKYLFDPEHKGVFKVVFGDSPGNGWLIGEPFLRQYHVVFNHEDNTVGFYNGKKYTFLSFIFALNVVSEYMNTDINMLVGVAIFTSLSIILYLVIVKKRKEINVEPLISRGNDAIVSF